MRDDGYGADIFRLLMVLRGSSALLPRIICQSKSTVSIQAPVWLTDTCRIPFPLSGGRCLCVGKALYAVYKNRFHPVHPCTHASRRQTLRHIRAVTFTKEGMSQSSPERISSPGLGSHYSLSASLFTFVSIHIKAFFSSFAQPANMTHCHL